MSGEGSTVVCAQPLPRSTAVRLLTVVCSFFFLAAVSCSVVVTALAIVTSGLGSTRLSLHVRVRVRGAGAKIVVRIPADARVRSQWTSVLNSTPGLHSKILRDLYSGESAALASEDVSKYQVKKLEVQVVNVNNVKAYSVEITFDVSNDKAVPTSHRGTLMVTSTGEVHSYIDDPNFDE